MLSSSRVLQAKGKLASDGQVVTVNSPLSKALEKASTAADLGLSHVQAAAIDSRENNISRARLPFGHGGLRSR